MDESTLDILFWFSITWLIICGYIINVVLLHTWNLGRKNRGNTESLGFFERIVVSIAMVIPLGVLALIVILFVLAVLLGIANWLMQLIFYGEL